MGIFQIGVMVDSFRLDLEDGIRKAKEVGASGIQIYATYGRMAPENLTVSQRKEILDIIKSEGLVVSALCGDFGGHGFAKAEHNGKRIEKSKRILDLAKDFECSVVTTHVGVIPEDEGHPRRAIIREACEKLGEYADTVKAFFAIETGPEPALVLKGFLDSLSSKGVRVNFDPANLVMVLGEDPAKSAEILGEYIVHTHAKDGILVKKTDPEIIYNFFAEGGIEDFRLEDYFREVPLGKGEVDFDRYLDALAKTGFKGFLAIEREVGENPEQDIQEAVLFLKSKI
jgi:sugar phosphate isomerase/epimerase